MVRIQAKALQRCGFVAWSLAALVWMPLPTGLVDKSDAVRFGDLRKRTGSAARKGVNVSGAWTGTNVSTPGARRLRLSDAPTGIQDGHESRATNHA